MRRRVLTCLVFTAFVVMGNEIQVSTAEAVLRGTVLNAGPTGLNTARWGAVAAENPVSGTTGIYDLGTISLVKDVPLNSLFRIRNTGTIPLSSVVLTFTTTGKGNFDSVIEACSGTWDPVTGDCSATLSTVRTHSGADSTTATYTRSINPNATVQLRIQFLSGSTKDIGASISLSVSLSNVNRVANTANV